MWDWACDLPEWEAQILFLLFQILVLPENKPNPFHKFLIPKSLQFHIIRYLVFLLYLTL